MADKKGRKGEATTERGEIKIDLFIHDLKGPLAVIYAAISSLLMKPEKYGPLTEKQERALERALRNTKITQTLVNDALELGRSREGIANLTNFRISRLIMQSLVEFFDLADHRISEDIKMCSDLLQLKEILQERGLFLFVDDALWSREVCLDELKMTQVLRNLLSNALKYRKRRVELDIDIEGDSLRLSIKDDGEGIPSIYHKKIFECYFQMVGPDFCVVRGHGLGLAGVMVLVEDMGGRLFLDSDEGKGAKFIVKVPISK
jgi:two-component system OmpR family sensor kinase